MQKMYIIMLSFLLLVRVMMMFIYKKAEQIHFNCFGKKKIAHPPAALGVKVVKVFKHAQIL